MDQYLNKTLPKQHFTGCVENKHIRLYIYVQLCLSVQVQQLVYQWDNMIVKIKMIATGETLMTVLWMVNQLLAAAMT